MLTSRSEVGTLQRSNPSLIAHHQATIDTTLDDSLLRDSAAVMAFAPRGDGQSRPIPENPRYRGPVAAGHARWLCLWARSPASTPAKSRASCMGCSSMALIRSRMVAIAPRLGFAETKREGTTKKTHLGTEPGPITGRLHIGRWCGHRSRSHTEMQPGIRPPSGAWRGRCSLRPIPAPEWEGKTTGCRPAVQSLLTSHHKSVLAINGYPDSCALHAESPVTTGDRSNLWGSWGLRVFH